MRRIAGALAGALVLAHVVAVGGLADRVEAAELGQITGIVSTPQGVVPQANVLLYQGGNADPGQYLDGAQTDEFGEFVFQVEPGEYSVSVDHEGYTFVAPGTLDPAQYLTITITADETFDAADISIPAPTVLNGSVSDGTSPLPNVNVVAASASPFQPDRQLAVTDAAGEYTASVYGDVVLRFDPDPGSGLQPRYYPNAGSYAGATPVGGAPGATVELDPVVLGAPGTISGNVTGIDGNSTRAVVRVWDAATTFADAASSQPVAMVESPDGVYSFAGLAPGDYVVSISPWYDEPVPFAMTYYGAAGGVIAWDDATLVTLASGASVSVDVRAQPGRSVTGVVTDSDSNPLAGVEVNASGAGNDPRIEWRSTFTADDGTYTLTGLAPGPVRLYAGTFGGTSWLLGEYYEDDYTEAGSSGLTVSASGPADTADFTLDRGIGGFATAQLDGVAVAPVVGSFTYPTICLAPSVPGPGIGSCDTPLNAGASSTTDGYHLAGLHPNTYTIAMADWSGVGDVFEFTVGWGDRVDCELALPGSTVGSTCVVSQETASGTISGVVTDPYGDPVAGAVVHLHDSEHGILPTGGYTLSDGSYAIERVPPGTYQVKVTDPYRVGAYNPSLVEWWSPTGDVYGTDYASAGDIVVTEGGAVTDIDVQLDLPVTGEVTVGDGAPIAQLYVVACPIGTTVTGFSCDDGQGGIEPGQYVFGPDGTARFENLLPGGYTFAGVEGHPFFGGATVISKSFDVVLPPSHTFECVLPLLGSPDGPSCSIEAVGFVDDSDGVDAGEESGAPNDGDGNDDDIPDNEQPSVASLEDPSIDDGDGDGSNYVTIAATVPGGASGTPTPIRNVTLIQPTAPPPPYVTPQSSLLSFDADVASPGGDLVLRIFLPQQANSYYKYIDGDWIDATALAAASFDLTSTTIGGVARWGVTLTLADGGPLDADGVANGVVVDPGMFALTDTTPPTVELVGLSSGDTFTVGDPIPAECVTNDDDSGVAVSAQLTVSAVGTAHPDGVGTFLATCDGAVDNAGNAGAAVSASYRVFYAMADEVFTGGSAVASPAVNEGKAGRTYPLRWTLWRADGTAVTDIAAVTSWSTYSIGCDHVSGPVEALPDSTTTESTSLQVSASGEFKLNYKTSKDEGCRILVISLVDGNFIVARFKLR